MFYDRNKIIFNFTFSVFFSQLRLLGSLGVSSTREFPAHSCMAYTPAHMSKEY